jgi:hypothetical protein
MLTVYQFKYYIIHFSFPFEIVEHYAEFLLQSSALIKDQYTYGVFHVWCYYLRYLKILNWLQNASWESITNILNVFFHKSTKFAFRSSAHVASSFRNSVNFCSQSLYTSKLENFTSLTDIPILKRQLEIE